MTHSGTMSAGRDGAAVSACLFCHWVLSLLFSRDSLDALAASACLSRSSNELHSLATSRVSFAGSTSLLAWAAMTRQSSSLRGGAVSESTPNCHEYILMSDSKPCLSNRAHIVLRRRTHSTRLLGTNNSNLLRLLRHVRVCCAADGLSRFRLPLVFLPLNDLEAVAGGLLKLSFVHNR
jgi:hypothetical protein